MEQSRGQVELKFLNK